MRSCVPLAAGAAPRRRGRVAPGWAWILAGLAVVAPQGEPDRGPDGAPPGARSRVGGLLALQARSVVHFHVPEGSPAPAPHQLVVTFAFPDRARWRLEPLAGRPGGRRIAYRFGASAWVLEPDQARSRQLAGEEAAGLLGALELRQALMLWPHGATWIGGSDQRRAELAGGRVLVAHLDAGGAGPTSIEVRDSLGTVHERFAGIEWARFEGRSWPARFDFQVRGQPVWREELTEVELDVRHVDAFFQPHDMRPPPPASGTRPPQLVEVSRQRLRRVELPEGCDWPTAERRFTSLLAAEAEELEPLTLDASLRVELDPRGAPVALFLVLAGDAPAELPVGYRTEPAGSALALLVDDPLEIDSELLRELGRASPEGVTAAWPARARLRPPGAEGPRAQVLLPLAP